MHYDSNNYSEFRTLANLSITNASWSFLTSQLKFEVAEKTDI